MVVLTLRTDKPEAEISLYSDSRKLTRVSWHADRKLAETIHIQLRAMLEAQNHNFHDLEGIVVYKGPGSFTGLRIGISVANALADGLSIPIVATTGADWTKLGLERLAKGDNEYIALPEYGAPPHITQPKK